MADSKKLREIQNRFEAARKTYSNFVKRAGRTEISVKQLAGREKLSALRDELSEILAEAEELAKVEKAPDTEECVAKAALLLTAVGSALADVD